MQTTKLQHLPVVYVSDMVFFFLQVAKIFALYKLIPKKSLLGNDVAITIGNEKSQPFKQPYTSILYHDL